jgi:HSP20 family protein
MTFIKFGPVNDYGNFNQKIHNFFDEFPNIGLDLNFSLKLRSDYYFDADNVYIDIEIPGVKKEDIKLSLKENLLTVAGEKKDLQKDNKKTNIYKNERVFGGFSRSFQLPEGLNTESIEAAYEEGILKIKIAKSVKNSAQEKEIKIK